jgi:hypothetical protein
MIRAGHHAHGAVRDVHAVGADISALVVEDLVLDPEDAAVFINRNTCKVTLLAALVGAHQVLAPILDPFHRPLELHRRDQHQQVLRIKLAADAETAADMALMHMQRRRAAIEHAAERLAIAMRDLRGAVQLQQVLRRVVDADCSARFHRHAGVAAGLEIELDDGVGIAKRRLDVAEAVMQHDRFGRAAGLELTGRIAGGHHHRQLLDLDRDVLSRVLGDIRVFGEDGRHRIADVAHIGLGQRRLAEFADAGGVFVGAEIDRRQVGDVGIGPYRDHARHLECGGRVDRDDLSVRPGRAHDPHVKLVRKIDVAGITAAPGHQRAVFDARDGVAEHAPF